MRFHGRFSLGLIAVALVSFACVTTRGTTPQPGKSGEAASEKTEADSPEARTDPDLSSSLADVVALARRARHTYKIGPDDLLRLSVWRRPDLSKEGVVRDDGAFFVPLAGNIAVAGLSVAEAQEAIRLALLSYFRDPQVDLEVKEYRSQVFFANGQFHNPGAYPIRSTTTVLEAIGAAGGITDQGSLGGAYLVRGGRVIPIDFVALFTRGKMSHNLPMADGDLLYVPSVSLTRVFVLGEVLRPAGVPMRTKRITLAQAIADAGGFNETTAYKRGIKIIRGGIGAGEVIEVNFQDVIKGKRPDLLLLEPGDIVYVPASGLAKWDRALGLILPNLSRIIVDAAAVNAMTR